MFAFTVIIIVVVVIIFNSNILSLQLWQLFSYFFFPEKKNAVTTFDVE